MQNKVEEQERETFERDDANRKEKEYHDEQLADANKALRSAGEVLAQQIMREEAASEDLTTNRAMLSAKAERLVEAEQQANNPEEFNNYFGLLKQVTAQPMPPTHQGLADDVLQRASSLATEAVHES